MDASTSVWATHLQGITLSAMRSRRVPDVPTAQPSGCACRLVDAAFPCRLAPITDLGSYMLLASGRARSGLVHRSKRHPHSTTSSALQATTARRTCACSTPILRWEAVHDFSRSGRRK